MAAKRRKADAVKIYQRNGRWWGDFRKYAAAGGRREPLVAAGDSMATEDRDTAVILYGERLKELKGAQAERRHAGRAVVRLAEYAAEHLRKKAREGKVTHRWLEQSERHLRAAVEYFGADTPLTAIDTSRLGEWVEHLRAQPNGRGGTLSDTTVRKFLNTVSNLLKRAVSEQGQTGVQANAASQMFSRPTEKWEETAFLSARDAALFFEANRAFQPKRPDQAWPYGFEAIATIMLTGMRLSEMRGLLVDDVSFENRTIRVEPNKYRPRLKTPRSTRTIPLWPQLEGILREYLMRREREGGIGELLFPAGPDAPNKMVSEGAIQGRVRKLCDDLGIDRVTPHGLRHTYISARLQTCDGGLPVAPLSVCHEAGHHLTQIETRYGHTYQRQPEANPEVVEYRVEHFPCDEDCDNRPPSAATARDRRGTEMPQRA